MASSKATTIAKPHKISPKWLNTAARSIGATTVDVLQEMAPNISGITKTAASRAAELSRNVRAGRGSMVRLTSALGADKYIKYAKTAYGNALRDLKSGNFNNKAADEEYASKYMGLDEFDDFDFDDAFGDGDSFGDFDVDDSSSSTPNVQVYAPRDTGKATLAAANIISEGIQKSTKLQMETGRANLDATIALTGNVMAELKTASDEINGHLTAMEGSLASIVEFNNQSMLKFIESTSAFMDQVGQKSDDSGLSWKQGTNAADIFSSTGEMNFGAYKEKIKSGIMDALGPASIMASMINDDSIEMLIQNPLGFMSKAVIGGLLPKTLKTAITGVEKSFSSFLPAFFEKLGDWGTSELGLTKTSMVKKFIGKTFGVKNSRDEIELDAAINKDAVPFDGITHNTINRIIPKELREQTAYLKAIAGKMRIDTDKVRDNVDIFNASRGKWQKRGDIETDIARSVVDDVYSAFTSTGSGGSHLADQGLKLKTQEERDDFKKALENFFMEIEQTNKRLDPNDLTSDKSAIATIFKNMEGSHSKRTLSFLKALVEDMAKNNRAMFMSFANSRYQATRARNENLKRLSEDPDYYEVGATDFGKTDVNGDRIDDNSIIYQRLGFSKGRLKAEDAKRKEKQDKDTNARQATINYRINPKNNKAMSEREYREILGGDMWVDPESYKDDDMITTAFKNFKKRRADAQQARGQRDSIFKTASEGITGLFTDIIYGKQTDVAGGFTSVLKKIGSEAWQSVQETFITPLKNTLFGEKGEDGYRSGGIFNSFTNKFKDVLNAAKYHITGDAYVDSTGKEHAAKENSVVGNLKKMATGVKDAFMEKFFGKEELDENGNPTGKRTANGLFSTITDTFKKGIEGWKEAIFGTEDPEAEKKKFFEQVNEKAPAAITGGMVGGGLGLLGVGFLNPVLGVSLGMAGGLLAKSESFTNYLFGEKELDEDGNETGDRLGGLISKEMQKYVKDRKNPLIAGAVGGAISGQLGLGLIGRIAGGPVIGSLIGTGIALAAKSETFQKFLYGENMDKSEGKGFVGAVKNIFKRDGKSDKEGKDGAKALGIAGIGVGAGALAGIIAKHGVLGAALGPLGPIGGAVIGLGAAIKASSGTFRKWLFGEKDPETGEKKKHGLFGQFGNMLHAHLLLPLRNRLAETADDLKANFEYALNVTGILFEPLVNGLKNTVIDLKDKVTGGLKKIGSELKANLVDPIVEVVRDTIVTPFKIVAEKVGGILYKGAMGLIMAPFKIASKVVRVVTSPFIKAGKAVVKGTLKGINWFLKKTLGVLGKVTKTAFRVVTAPFRLAGRIGGAVRDRVRGKRANADLTNKPRLSNIFDSDLSTRDKLKAAKQLWKGRKKDNRNTKAWNKIRESNSALIARATNYQLTEDTEANRALYEQLRKKDKKLPKLNTRISAIDNLTDEEKAKKRETRSAKRMGEIDIADLDTPEEQQVSLLQKILNVITGKTHAGKDKGDGGNKQDHSGDNEDPKNKQPDEKKEDDKKNEDDDATPSTPDEITKGREVANAIFGALFGEGQDGRDAVTHAGDLLSKGLSRIGMLNADYQEDAEKAGLNLDDTHLGGFFGSLFGRKGSGVKTVKLPKGVKPRHWNKKRLRSDAEYYDEFINWCDENGLNPADFMDAYAEGTDNAPGGPSVVGEAGQETVVEDNKMTVLNKPTVTDLEPHSRVFNMMQPVPVFITGVSQSALGGSFLLGPAKEEDESNQNLGQLTEMATRVSTDTASLMGDVFKSEMSKEEQEAANDSIRVADKLKQQEEAHQKVLDRAKTAEELQEQKKKEESEKRENEKVTQLTEIKEETKKHRFQWSKIFSKEGLITAGILGFLLKFPNQALGILKGVAGLLPKLLEFLGGQVASTFRDISEDFTRGADSNTDHMTMGEKAREEIEDLTSLNPLTMIAGRDHEYDHETGARLKMIGIGLEKGINKGSGLVNGVRGASKGFREGQLFGKSGAAVKALREGEGASGAAKAWKSTKKGKIGSARAGWAEGSKQTAGRKVGENILRNNNILDAYARGQEKFIGRVADAHTRVTVGNLNKELASEISNAANPETLKQIQSVTGMDKTVMNAMEKKAYASELNKLFGSQVDDIAEGAAEMASKEAVKNAAKSGSGLVDDALKAGGNLADDALRAGEAAVAKVAEGDAGLCQKVLGMIRSWIKGLFESVGKKFGASKAGQLSMTAIEKVLAILPKRFVEIGSKISGFLSGTVAAAASLVGLAAKYGVFVIGGALEGATGAAALFEIDKSKVDGLMIAISSAIGAAKGTTVGGVVDIVNGFLASITQVDIIKIIASTIYRAIKTAIGRADEAEALDVAQDEWREAYDEYRLESRMQQFETMKASGNISDDMSFEEFNAQVNSRQIAIKEDSFQEFNDKNNAGVISKGARVAWNGTKKGFSAVKGFLVGNKNKVFQDANGTRYESDGKGSLNVFSASGENLGSISENAVDTSTMEEVGERTGFNALGKVKDSTFGQGVTQLFKFVKDGDLKGFLKYNPLLDIKDKGIGGMLQSVPLQIMKPYAAGPTILSFIGHKAFNAIKNIGTKVKNTINLVKEEFARGDQLITSNEASIADFGKIEEDPDNPISGLTKFITIGARLAAVPVRLIGAISKKVGRAIGNVAGKVKTSLATIGSESLRTWGTIARGDLNDLWLDPIDQDPENPVGGVTRGIMIAERLLATPFAMVSHVGHGIWNILKKVGGGVKNAFMAVQNSRDQIEAAAKTGDIGAMMATEVKDEEGNPVSGIMKGISAIQKILLVPNAALHWVGNKIKASVAGVVDKVSESKSVLDSSTQSITSAANKGDIRGVLSAKISLKAGDPLNGIWSALFNIQKVFGVMKGAVSLVGNKIKDLWGTVSDSVKNFFTNMLGGAKNIIMSEYGDSSASGGGYGTGPAPTTLNGFPYQSQNDPSIRNKSYGIPRVSGDKSTFGDAGCYPAAMSGVIQKLTGEHVGTERLGRLAQASGERDITGTNNSYLTNAGRSFGLATSEVDNPDAQFIRENVSPEHPMILSGTDDGSLGYGSPFTRAGHGVVVVGVHGDKAIVNNPLGVESSGEYDINALASQSNYGVVYSKGGTGRRRRGGRGPSRRIARVNGGHGIKRRIREGLLRLGGRGVDRTQWIAIVRAVKKYVAATKLGYSQNGWVDVTINGKTVHMRRDCSGFVSTCLQFYGVSTGMTWTGDMMSPTSGFMPKTGFSYRKWAGWDDLQEGDIIVNGSHTEIFARNENGTHYVYNCGSNASNNNPDATKTGHSSYTCVWSPGPPGSGAVTADTTGITSPTSVSDSATTTEATSSSGTQSVMGTLSTLFGNLASRISDGGLTGQYDTDWSTLMGSTTTSASSSTGSSTATGKGNFPKYSLTNEQINGIANIVQHEQPGIEGYLAEASQMANLNDKTGDDKATPERLVKTATGGWYAKGGDRYNAGARGSVKLDPLAVAAVKFAIVNGKRVLPRYVDEHDYFGDIKSISTGGSIKDRNAYKQNETVVKNKMGSTYTFYSFPNSKSDPFGYTNSSYRSKWGEDHYDYPSESQLLGGAGRRGGFGPGGLDMSGGVPSYQQNSADLNNIRYGSDGATLGDAGCGPSALASMRSYLTGQETSVEAIANDAERVGMRDETGTNASFISGEANVLGIDTRRIDRPTTETMRHSLRSGRPMMTLGTSDDDSIFTRHGHYLNAIRLDNADNVIYTDSLKPGLHSAPLSKFANQTEISWEVNGFGGRGNKYYSVLTPGATRGIRRRRGGRGGLSAAMVIAVAKQEVGYLEKKSNSQLDDKTANAGSDNYTKYWASMEPSFQRQPWCACFVCWCFEKAAGSREAAQKALRGAYSWACQTLMTQFNKAGALDKNPQPGDLIFFESGAKNVANHIGIVERVDGNTVHTIEGNTSAGNNTVIANGGGVAEKSYNKDSSRILGYGHPAYDSTASATVSGESTGSSKPTLLGSLSSILNEISTRATNGVITGQWDTDYSSFLSSLSGTTASAAELDGSSSGSASVSSSGSVSSQDLGQQVTADQAHHRDPRSYSKITTEQLRAAIEKQSPGSALAKKANEIMEAAEATGIDPRFIAAFAAQESGWNGSNYSKGRNNYFGIGAFDSNPDAAYSFSGNGFTGGMSWIKKNYIDAGQNTFWKMDNAENGWHNYNSGGTNGMYPYAKIYSTLINNTGGAGKGKAKAGAKIAKDAMTRFPIRRRGGRGDAVATGGNPFYSNREVVDIQSVLQSSRQAMSRSGSTGGALEEMLFSMVQILGVIASNTGQSANKLVELQEQMPTGGSIYVDNRTSENTNPNLVVRGGSSAGQTPAEIQNLIDKNNDADSRNQRLASQIARGD